MRGVTALSGKIPFPPGRTITMLHSNATQLPVSNVTGNNSLWLEEPSNNRAICGTANPIKEMGPQKAVAVAVRIPVQSRIKTRVRFTFMPRLAAYISPKRSAFNGLINNMERSRPTSEQVVKKGNC